mgnify:FL=1
MKFNSTFHCALVLFLSVIFSNTSAQPLTLVYPQNNVTVDTTAITFNWNSETTAVSYDLQLATDAAFTLNVQNFNGIASASKFVNTLSSDQTYYWHVRSFDGFTYSGWSPYRVFSTFIPSDIAGLKLWLRADRGIDGKS